MQRPLQAATVLQYRSNVLGWAPVEVAGLIWGRKPMYHLVTSTRHGIGHDFDSPVDQLKGK